MKTRIYVVTHKEYDFPELLLYKPIVAGASEYDLESFPNSYLRDDCGENISDKHDLYSEFTALYWIWRNSKADLVGLNHYRRYFITGGFLSYLYCILNPKKNTYRHILDKKNLSYILNSGYDCILPKKQWRVKRTLREEFCSCHSPKLLKEVGRIIQNKYPSYAKVFEEVLNKRENYQKCICVMKRDRFNSYVSWMFDIFEEMEKLHVNWAERDFAFLGERLMNVWVEKQKKEGNLKVKELYFVNTELTFTGIHKTYSDFYFPKFLKPIFLLMMSVGLWKY